MHKVKFDDFKCFQNFLNADFKFMFKFDLKRGYHPIDINENFQTYLGFFWKIDGKIFFKVLPFGLNSDPFLFTKSARPLAKYWRRHLIKIACFLDDGLSVAESFSEAICNSQFVQETLQKSGFIVNCEKLFWEPQEVMTWLGITLDLRAKMFHISNTRIESILNTLSNLTNTPYVTARKVAQTIGKINSMIFDIKNCLTLVVKFESLKSR